MMNEREIGRRERIRAAKRKKLYQSDGTKTIRRT